MILQNDKYSHCTGSENICQLSEEILSRSVIPDDDRESRESTARSSINHLRSLKVEDDTEI